LKGAAHRNIKSMAMVLYFSDSPDYPPSLKSTISVQVQGISGRFAKIFFCENEP